MRRVCEELRASIGETATEDMIRQVEFDINDADQPWWTPMSGFENDKEQQDRVIEFITFTRYCKHKLPVFVGHSLFFKAFYSKRVSTMLAHKRPLLSDSLKRYRLSNASLLAVTVLYVDKPNHVTNKSHSNNRTSSGCSDCVIVDADLIFGGGFHGIEYAAAKDGVGAIPPTSSSLHSSAAGTTASGLVRGLSSYGNHFAKRSSTGSGSGGTARRRQQQQHRRGTIRGAISEEVAGWNAAAAAQLGRIRSFSQTPAPIPAVMNGMDNSSSGHGNNNTNHNSSHGGGSSSNSNNNSSHGGVGGGCPTFDLVGIGGSENYVIVTDHTISYRDSENIAISSTADEEKEGEINSSNISPSNSYVPPAVLNLTTSLQNKIHLSHVNIAKDLKQGKDALSKSMRKMSSSISEFFER